MNFEISPKSTEIRLNWFDAKLYCFSLNIDGKTGWRLPTKDELNQIYESENDYEEWYYWSSTEYDADNAWYQGFDSGAQFNYANSKILGNAYIRAVRDL